MCEVRSVVLYGVVLYGIIWYGTVRAPFGTVLNGGMRCCIVRCDMPRLDAVRCGGTVIVRCGAVPCGARRQQHYPGGCGQAMSVGYPCVLV